MNYTTKMTQQNFENFWTWLRILNIYCIKK